MVSYLTSRDRFRWVFCQLETLRRSFPAAIRRTLEELPETLDATYERTLLGIEKEKREYAHRLFQCLSVAIRPLRVEELVNVLAIRFDANKLPQYHEDWCPVDAQDAVLSACSSLVVIVNVHGSPIIQFSHFSVREFLTSDRLAEAAENISRYHIILQSAHTILAQASLSILLHIDDHVDKKSMEKFPFANYAARHWVDHARFENVMQSIQDAMERLFDRAKPQFATWVWIYDIDHTLREHMSATRPTLPEATPLYYSTLCGFCRVVEHLLVTDPGDINTVGGYYGTCLQAGLAKGNIDIVLLLLDNGADVNSPDQFGWSPLHYASESGRRDLVEFLLEHHADVNIRDQHGSTPLHIASARGELEIVQALLRHGADADRRSNDGFTPLHSASHGGSVAVLMELLHIEDVNVQADGFQTLLHIASKFGHLDVIEFLIQYGAAIDTKTPERETALHLGCGKYGCIEVARFLVDHGADPNSRDNMGNTPFHVASINGHLDIIRLLLDLIPDVDVRGRDQTTPLMLASWNGMLEASRFLIENGADVNSAADEGWTASHYASASGHFDILLLLLDHGADINGQADSLSTSLHLASENGYLDVTKLLIERGAAIDERDANQRTPLHRTAINGDLEIARLLIRHGSSLNAEDSIGRTPLHTVAEQGHLDVVELLLESGGDVNVRDNNNKTALDLALENGKLNIARLLAECIGSVNSLRWDEEANALNREQGTSLFSALKSWDLGLLRSMVDRGADVNERDEYSLSESPLHVAAKDGWLAAVKLLVTHGARVSSRDNNGWTPLLRASQFGYLGVARFLLDRGADVNAKKQDLWTALHLASVNGHDKIVELLLERGADVHVLNADQRTPSQEALRTGSRRIILLLSDYGGGRI
jgi:ankyrin repeat protein